ncbi:hypothetical protein [Haloplanus salilacus]|uniref:hypothetical protein n=1 Tax=Haloplanus salilacus TaxID=2949994 RepID=UPI0030CD511E
MFYVFDNGGEMRYPPGGLREAEPDGYSQRSRELWDAGFYFHYDGGRNHVACYFKGAIGSGQQLVNNQFYGVYYGDGTDHDLLAAFEDELESAFDSQGWRTSDSDMGTAAIYANLTSVQPVDLAVDQELLRAATSDESETADGPIQLGAPDFTSSLRVCKRLIADLEDARVTICSAGASETLPDTDVVVIPEATDEPGAPARGTKVEMQKKELRRRITETKADLEDFVEGEQARARALVESIESGFLDPTVPDVESLGYRLDTPARKAEKESRDTTFYTGLGGILGTVLTVVALWYVGVVGRLVESLSSEVTFQLGLVPGVEPPAFATTPIGSWQIVGVCLVVIGLMAGWGHTDRIVAELRTWISGGDGTDAGSVDGANEAAKSLVADLEEILNHPATERSEFSDVPDGIFEGEVHLNVYDDADYRSSTRNTLVLSMLKGIGAVGVVGVLFAGVAWVASQYWQPSLSVLVGLAIGSVLLRLPRAATTVAPLLFKAARSGSLPDRRASAVGGALLLGGWSVSQAGAVAWQRGSGLPYHLVSGIGGELPGRVVGPAAGVEVLFFGVVGGALAALGVAAWRSPEPLVQRALLAATVVGLVNLWLSVDFVSAWGWLAGVASGIGVAAAATWRGVSPDRLTRGVGGLYGVVVVVVGLESQLQYQSPLVYDASAGGFVGGTPSFAGYAYSLSASRVALTLVHIAIAAAVLYVLWTEVFGSDRTEVMVVGPDGDAQIRHMSLLFGHFLTDVDGDEPEPNDAMKRIRKRDDGGGTTPMEEILDTDGVLPASFTVDSSNLLVWTPLTSGTVLSDEVFTRLDRKLNSRTNLTEDTVRGAPQYVELAISLQETDVLVLLFPADDDDDERRQKYLNDCYKLLEQFRDEELTTIGVITGADHLIDGVATEQWENFREVATEEAFEGYSQERREILLSYLDNADRGVLLPVVETMDGEIEGLDRAVGYFDGSGGGSTDVMDRL